MNFISPNNQKQNIIVLKNETKRKKRLRKKVSKRYILLPPRMLNLPKSNKQPSMIHYHFLSGFGRPASLNEAPQPSFHRGDSSPTVKFENIFPDESFEFSNPLKKNIEEERF